MLRELAARNPKARRARPDEFVNLAFIKELDNSDFIDRLYKAQSIIVNREERPAPAASIPQIDAYFQDVNRTLDKINELGRDIQTGAQDLTKVTDMTSLSNNEFERLQNRARELVQDLRVALLQK